MNIWDASSQAPARPLRLAFSISYAAFIGVNVASAVGWLGPTNAEVSAKFQTPLTPAGWAFGIWGLIFALQGLGVLYSLWDDYDPDGAKARYVHAVAPWWGAAWLAAIGWQLAFLQQTPTGMWLALLLIAASLAGVAAALAALFRLRSSYGAAPSLQLYAFYFLPTSVMTAWLSVATSVQLLIALLGTSGAGGALETAAVLLAAAVTVAAAWVCISRHDTAYGLTAIWALVAVFEKSASVPVHRTALAGIVVTGLATLVSVLRRRPDHGSSGSVAYQPLVEA